MPNVVILQRIASASRSVSQEVLTFGKREKGKKEKWLLPNAEIQEVILRHPEASLKKLLHSG